MMLDYIILAIISTTCGGVFALKITSFLSKHGVKINYWLLRFYMLKYLWGRMDLVDTKVR